MDMFWMVLADNSAETRVRHTSFDVAQREARRLASNHKGTRFYVLQCVGAAVMREPTEWITASDPEIPF